MIQKIYNHKSVLICVHRATRGSGWPIKTQVLYEHTLSGHNPSGHRYSIEHNLAGHRQAGKQMDK